MMFGLVQIVYDVWFSSDSVWCLV